MCITIPCAKSSRCGHALALALLMIAAAALLGNALLTGTQSLVGYSQRREQKLMSMHLAESALRWQAYRLIAPRRDTLRDPEPFKNPVQSASITMDTTDLWVHLTSVVGADLSRVTVEADLGKPLHEGAFQYAIRLLDVEPLRDLISMRVQGDVLERGLPAKISNDELRTKLMSLALRPWNRYLNTLSLVLADSVDRRSPGYFRGRNSILRLEDWAPFPLMVIENGDMTVDLPRKISIPGLRRIVVQGEVQLRGEVDFDTLVIIAEGPVHLKGTWHGKRLEIFTKSKMTLEGDLHFEAALHAQGDLSLLGSPIRFQGTSVAMTYSVPQSPEVGQGLIRLDGDIVYNGWIICGALGKEGPGGSKGQRIEAQLIDPLGVYIHRQAKIYGVVYSSRVLRNEGFIGGVAVAARLDCGDLQGANCGGSGVFDRDSLPLGFVQPAVLDFGERQKSWAVRLWRRY